ncbi:hypothetical protein HUJ05_003643 [Dendroctonus ponderosae]|nr:hypothetical protein HUJ05_003643 [Dendroctonus ponderosae]
MESELENLPEPGSRYTLGEIIGNGAFGTVYNAIDNQTSNKINVAIKIQTYNEENKPYVDEEYAILKELSSCIYLVTFYGIFKRGGEIWIVLENCKGCTALDLVTGLLNQNRRISEEHMGYILKEVVKGIVYLHESNVIHRDVKGSNILLTKEGEVKLCDFGLGKKLTQNDDKLYDCVGSSCWMAPELVTANKEDSEKGFYDNRVDVWALGITAIELAEGAAPFRNMQPCRVLFEIVKNPPPALEKISNWTENFHDFISECLVQYFEHRPYIVEIIQHPFLEVIPENNYHLSLEIKTLIVEAAKVPLKVKPTETVIIETCFKSSADKKLKKIVEEDLANLDRISEETVLSVIEERFQDRQFYTFVGEILVAVNPNEPLDIFGKKFHELYFQKSRSNNLPHIYSVADTAYQNAMHHKIPQQLILTGESASGKTSNYLHLIDHLFFIGEQHPVNVSRIRNGINLIHALTHANTSTNVYSTRCIFKTNISFGQSGKISAATFKTWCLEKSIISSVDMNQSTFHVFYYIYDGLVHSDATGKYKLHSERNYRYMRIPDHHVKSKENPRDNIEQNVINYKKIFSCLEEFEFSEEQIVTFFSVIAAILNLGDESTEMSSSKLQENEFVTNFCDLMEIDKTRFCWALTNYCIFKKGNVVKMKNTCDEGRNSRDVLANNLYSRFVDYVVGAINDKLEIGKAIFGNKYAINLLDIFGFECFKENHLPQFLVNCLNEQFQYHYIQKVFRAETQDLVSEDIEFETQTFFDNKTTLNHLLSKPDGVLSIIDEASKKNLSGHYIMDNLQRLETNRIVVKSYMEFAVAHFTGRVSYNSREMSDKNRDFLPAEVIETLRESENPIIRSLFLNKLDKTGCLVLNFDRTRRNKRTAQNKNNAGVNQFSQIRNLRTSGSIFRSVCLELMRELSIGGNSGGTHFIRCIRSDLKAKPHSFNRELVKQQIRSLALTETALIRQKGFPHRVSFSEFLQRYKFLAFDYDENVEITRENCRLLLIRLKMEGWVVGKSQVFLKYYNEEYLSRLYETQVRKIIKIQSIMRGFLAKCKLNKQNKDQERSCIQEIGKRRRSSVLTENEAAEIIQKAYRKSVIRHKTLSDIYASLSDEERNLISPFAKKWKMSSLFYILIKYRTAKLYDFFNLSQQVHFYNQNAFFEIKKNCKPVKLKLIDKDAKESSWFQDINPVALKMNFCLAEIPFIDTSVMCDSFTTIRSGLPEDCWDSPYRFQTDRHNFKTEASKDLEYENGILSMPYNRDPNIPLTILASTTDKDDRIENSANNKKVVSPCYIKKNYQSRYSDKRENNEEVKSNDSRYEPQMHAPIKFRQTEFKHRNDQVENDRNSTSGNKDFGLLKSSNRSAASRNFDPIAELRTITRRGSNEDDPPFNFQGMLRKTNFQRNSMKKASGSRRESLRTALETVRKFSLPKDKDEPTQKTEMNEKKSKVLNGRPVYMELEDGLILEGVQKGIMSNLHNRTLGKGNS